MVEVEPRVLMPEVVADPLPAAMDMRGLGMALAVTPGFPAIALMRSPVVGGRTMTRNVSSPEVMTSMILVLVMLRPHRQGEHKWDREHK
jgi:hypothetical protein